jgi:hypothetical protein
LITLLDIKKLDLSQYTLAKGRYDSALDSTDALFILPDRIVYGHTTAERGFDDLLEQLGGQLCLNAALITAESGGKPKG